MGEINDDLDDDNVDGSDLVKQLRKQLKEKDKALKERDDELSSFRAEKRSSSVADVLKERGARPELAKFYTGEDTSKEAVATWIDENADLFGISREADEPDDEESDAVRRASRTVAAAPEKRAGVLETAGAGIRGANSRDELYAAMEKAGIRVER